MSEREFPTRPVALALAACLIALALMEGAGIGNDRVTVSEPRVVIVLDPEQVGRVVDVLGCEANDGRD